MLDTTSTPTGAVSDGSGPGSRSPHRRRFLVALGAAGLLAGAALLLLAPGEAGGPGGPPNALRELPVTAMDMVEQPANNSPQLAVDPTEERFVVLANRLDGPDFGCALQVSGDAGRSWVSVDPVPDLPEGADKCYGPEIAFNADGALHYLFVGLSGQGNTPMGAFLTTSTDRGQSFSPPRQILGPHRYQVRMAIDPDLGRAGRLHLVWLEVAEDPPLGGLPAPPNPIMAAYSDDGGHRFSEPVQVSDPDRPLAVAPALAVGADHAVHVAYYDLQDDLRDYQGLEGPVWDGHWSLAVASSTDAGSTFSHHTVVDDEVVPPERVMLIFTMSPPALAAGPEGALYAAWHDARNGDWDAWLRPSTDGGRIWQERRRLNDDPVGGGSHQYLPQISVAPGGRVDAIFYDRRNNEENRGNDVYYTYSTDGGTRFADNLRLTRVHFDSQIGPRYAVASAAGLVEFGSRIALLSEEDEAVAAWTDSRNTGRTPRSQDIFATKITYPVEGNPPPWPPVLGTVLAVLGLAVVAIGWRRRPHPAVLLGGLAILGACTSQPSVLPPTPPMVNVRMDEYSFDMAEDTLPAGRAVFSMANVGEGDHRLSLIPLPEDFPPIHEQVQSSDNRIVQQLATIPETPPGDEAAFAVDLRPDRRYGLACFVVDADGKTHAEKGMVAEFRTR